MTDHPIPRGRGFRQAVLGDLDELADQLGRLAEDRDADARAYAGLVVTRRVVVNLKSGTAIAGIVVGHNGPLIELADAVLLTAGDEPRAMDGRAVVERSDVDFIQIP